MKTTTLDTSKPFNAEEHSMKSGPRSHFLWLLLAFGVACGRSSTQAQWVRWEVTSGGNGHLYKAVPNTNGVITPRIASELAEQDGGHLATITSPEENAFVFSLVNSPVFYTSSNGSGPVLGGRQQEGGEEPAGGWYWTTGEVWGYTNWSADQPDDRGGGEYEEDSLSFHSGMSSTPAPTWNDLGVDEPNCGGYVVEKDEGASPASYVKTSLAVKGSWAATNGIPISGISASGTRALLRIGDSGVRLLDLSNPAAPVSLGSWNTLLSLSDAVMGGNLAYVASWELDFLSTVEIVDFTDPVKPVLVGYYDTPGYAEELLLRGSTLYVADAEGGLLILDVGDPANPRRIGGYDTKGSVQHVEVAGNYAYIPDGNWLIILDVSDPGNPRRVNLYEVAEGISSLKAYGTKLYLADGSGALRILDVSKPASILLVGTYKGWGNPAQAMAVSGRYLYLAKGTGGLHVLDVNDPTKPTYLTGAWSSPAEDVAVMGKNILGAGGDKGLMVYQLQQDLYPPLAAPVISAGTMTLTWATSNDVRLQKATDLVNAVWQDVPESENTNTVTLPMTEPTAFFRLVKGPKLAKPSTPITLGLVGLWDGEHNADDSSGMGNHGVLVGDIGFVPGVFGEAFDFHGGLGMEPFLGYVQVPDNPSLDGFTQATWSFWVKLPDPTGPVMGFVDKLFNCGQSEAYVIYVNDGSELFGSDLGIELGTSAGGWSRNGAATDRSVLTADQWHHVAVTFDMDAVPNVVFYVDAVSRPLTVSSDLNGPIHDSSADLVIGAVKNGNCCTLKGAMDQVALYNRALTADEIRAIYDAGSAGKVKPGH